MCLFYILCAAHLQNQDYHIENKADSDTQRLMVNTVHLFPGMCMEAVSQALWETL